MPKTDSNCRWTALTNLGVLEFSFFTTTLNTDILECINYTFRSKIHYVGQYCLVSAKIYLMNGRTYFIWKRCCNIWNKRMYHLSFLKYNDAVNPPYFALNELSQTYYCRCQRKICIFWNKTALRIQVARKTTLQRTPCLEINRNEKGQSMVSYIAWLESSIFFSPKEKKKKGKLRKVKCVKIIHY